MDDPVSATLNYLAPWSARNSLYVAPGDQLTTTQYDPRTVPVRDGRPHRGELTLDVAGFELISHLSAVTDFGDADALNSVYVPESVDLVRELTGADHAVFLNWMIRNSSSERSGALPPAPDVHVDLHTTPIARRYAQAHATSPLPEPTAYRRAVYTSLWRTFSPPPQDWPLALCDYRSVPDDEGAPNVLFRVPALPAPEEILFPAPGGAVLDGTVLDGTVLDETVLDEVGAESAASVFAYRPWHRWWYFPAMHAGEALIIKLHDTDHRVAWRAPHTSFHDASASGAFPRQSIELRSVAYFY